MEILFGAGMWCVCGATVRFPDDNNNETEWKPEK